QTTQYVSDIHHTMCILSLILSPNKCIFPLSLHDALPISAANRGSPRARTVRRATSCRMSHSAETASATPNTRPPTAGQSTERPRSEEHTSELQSRFDLVCRLLLEKKKNKHIMHIYRYTFK